MEWYCSSVLTQPPFRWPEVARVPELPGQGGDKLVCDEHNEGLSGFMILCYLYSCITKVYDFIFLILCITKVYDRYMMLSNMIL
jgi:hypothetical protein